MASTEIDTLVEQRMRVLHVLCATLLLSVGVYAGVAYVLLQQGGLSIAKSSALPSALPLVLCAVAVAALVAAPSVSRLVLGSAAGNEDPAQRLNAYQSSVVIGFAVREAAAVIGLVLSLLTGALVWVAALAAAAAAAMLLAWPRRDRLAEIASGATGTVG